MTTDKTNLSSVYLCARCHEWWGVPLQLMACAVKHSPDSCCHYGEVRVPMLPHESKAMTARRHLQRPILKNVMMIVL